MATADPFIDHITCAVCYEIYNNPHILNCLHTYCKICIDKLKKHSVILCPECRKTTSSKEVKFDFKSKSLVDMYQRGSTVNEEGLMIVSKQQYVKLSEKLNSLQIRETSVMKLAYGNMADEWLSNIVHSPIEFNKYTFNCSWKIVHAKKINRIRKINNEIWCVTDDGLYIVGSRDRMVQPYIENDRRCQSMRSFAEISCESIVLACGMDYGLFLVTNYNEKRRIAAGSFSDVSIQGRKMYALRYLPNDSECHYEGKVLVFDVQADGSCNKVDKLNLKHRTNRRDRLCIDEKFLYISSWSNEKIYIFGTHDLMKKMSIETKCLDSIILCSSIPYSASLLLVDYYEEDSIHIYNRLTNEFNELGLEGRLVDCARDILVDDDGDTVWVATNKPVCQILKFSKH